MSELIASEVIRKLKRLGAMRPRELAHRVREKVYSELDRIGAGIGIGGPPAAVPTPFKNYLAGAPGDRFYCSHREKPAAIRPARIFLSGSTGLSTRRTNCAGTR